MKLASENKTRIMPIDSEHSAIYQSIVGERWEDISKIILTCSGGPFRETPSEQILNATVKEALNHPTWKMGGKISIDDGRKPQDARQFYICFYGIIR